MSYSKENWLKDHRKGLFQSKSLFDKSLITEAIFNRKTEIEDQLNIRVPHQWIKSKIIERDDIKKQVIPSLDELKTHPLEDDDPIGDDKHSPFLGLTHRYPDRILLKPTYQCALYCRFCFRRSKVSHQLAPLTDEWLANVAEYISQNPRINEIILTGGDPLTLTDKKLKAIMTMVGSLPQITRIRFHTRVPTALPSRINQELLDIINSSHARLYFVLHINAASELTTEARDAMNLIIQHGIQTLSQSVLLKGINTSENSLLKLFNALVDIGIIPYYLHYPDLAKGTNQFRIPLTAAQELMAGLRGKISGYAIPRLIVDIPGGLGKIQAEKPSMDQVNQTRWLATSPLTNERIDLQYPE